MSDEDNSTINHEHLLKIVVRDEKDYQDFGKTDRETPDDNWLEDCSGGCRHYALLAGQLGSDWGVCTNAKSHRCGLLTFEHQGCAEFEADPNPEENFKRIYKETLEVVKRLIGSKK